VTQLTILVVEDDHSQCHIMAYALERAGYRALMAEEGQKALEMIHMDPPDLVLLDIGLPDMDGLELLRQIPKSVPVIMVTGRHTTSDEVLGLELGAQDYITKPFTADVLLARVRALLRRSRPVTPPVEQAADLQVGDLLILPSARSVMVGGRPVRLSRLEFRLLYTLAQHAGQVLPAQKLLDAVWGPDHEGEPQALYVYMRALRKKIEEDHQAPCRLLTIHGVGYTLNPLVPVHDAPGSAPVSSTLAISSNLPINAETLLM
jgi:two-component system, OmpR family, response regulator VicR